MVKKIIVWILQIILSLFVLGGAVNDGFSYFIFAIPFAIPFFIIAYRSKSKIHLFYSAFILIISLIFIFTRTHNPLLYPSIGENITFNQPIPVTKFTNKNGIFSYDEEVPLFTKNPIDKKYIENEISLPKGEYRITSIRIDHPDFGSKYQYFLSNSKTGERFQVGSVVIMQKNGWIFNDEASEDLIELAKLTENSDESIKKFKSIRPVFFNLSLLMAFPAWPTLLKKY